MMLTPCKDITEYSALRHATLITIAFLQELFEMINAYQDEEINVTKARRDADTALRKSLCKHCGDNKAQLVSDAHKAELHLINVCHNVVQKRIRRMYRQIEICKFKAHDCFKKVLDPKRCKNVPQTTLPADLPGTDDHVMAYGPSTMYHNSCRKMLGVNAGNVFNHLGAHQCGKMY